MTLFLTLWVIPSLLVLLALLTTDMKKGFVIKDVFSIVVISVLYPIGLGVLWEEAIQKWKDKHVTAS